MSKFAIIRLGKDSVDDIRRLDALSESPAQPVSFTVRCAQVPQELAEGDYVFFCLGSDNNKGTPTPWTRGLRALGTVTAKSGGPGYNDPWEVAVEIKVVLPGSVTQKDLLAKAPAAYFWSSNLPVLGVDTHSNQTVQMVRVDDPNQNISALAYALNLIYPSFRQDVITAYPKLSPLFDYIPPAPDTASGSSPVRPETAIVSNNLTDLVGQFCADTERGKLRVSRLEAHRFLASLLSKRFLIATGLAGSGKTKLAQAVSRWLTPTATQADPFVQGAQIESERATYFVNASDDIAIEFVNSPDPQESTKVVLPRAMIHEWADYIRIHSLPKKTPAREIREAVKSTSHFSDQLHSFETHLKAAAFALIDYGESMVLSTCHAMVPVGADWTGNENVLGYPNGLESTGYVAKPALNLILQAKAHPEIPHFLILDEMNLSHVERYFADILSAIESGEAIPLHDDGERKSNGKPIPASASLPDNLFIIGTVNVDETTYMFSPKVLDRANVIEFRMLAEDLEAFLNAPAKPDLSLLEGKGASFGKAFVDAAKSSGEVPAEVREAYAGEMSLFFKAMRGHGAEFGYRVAHESSRFLHFYKLLGAAPEGAADWLPGAFDCVVVQKFLPKLHGSRAKLGPLLKKLWFLCITEAVSRGEDPLKAAEAVARSVDKGAEPSEQVPADAPYPLSAAKIGRMWRLLNENGFTSFAEA